MELRLEAADVKRALLRGAVCAAVSAAACALLEPCTEERPRFNYVSMGAVLDWSPFHKAAMAAVRGALLGLIATPLGILEALVAKTRRSRTLDAAVCVGLVLVLVVLAGVASLQATYTIAVCIQRDTMAEGGRAMLDELQRRDFVRDVLLCAASVAPAAFVTVLRARSAALSFQVLAGMSTAMIVLVAMVEWEVATYGIQATGMNAAVLWAFGTGLAFGPVASFADLVAVPQKETPHGVPS